MAATETVLDRLAKLMNFAANTTGPEAEVAAQRAAEIMAKYQIEAAEVAARAGKTADKPALEHGRIDADEAAKPNRAYNGWKGALLVAVAKGFGGSTYRESLGDGTWRGMMFGPVGTVAPARFLYVTLARELERRVRAFLKETGGRGPQGNAYLHGAVVRIATRLQEGRDTELRLASTQALAIIDKSREAAKEAVNEATNGGRKIRHGAITDAEAYVRGHEEAGSIDLKKHKKTLTD